jgi:hypothetical protein
MNLERDGFLSDRMTSVVQHVRKLNSEWFELATRLSRIGQAFLTLKLNRQTEHGLADPIVLKTLIFYRATSSFQGAVIMAERGMIAESRTLIRNCLECSLSLAALDTDPDHWKELLGDELASRKARARLLVSNPSWLTGDQLTKMAKHLDDLEAKGKLTFLDMKKLAEKSALAPLYLFYRQLSADSAHLSVESLNRYIEPDPHDETTVDLQWRPSLESNDVEDALSMATWVYLPSCIILRDTFPDAGQEKEIEECAKAQIDLANRQRAPGTA